ncbi:MAG: RNA methyltransferase [Oscillospiraceae bacterium]|nr:RNA methyltransferase [Oscillospiraceae bacterium]
MENPHIKSAVKLRDSSSRRRELEQFFLEGARLCADAFESGYRPLRCFVTARARERYGEGLAPMLAATESVYDIPPALAKKLGDTESPQGVFAVFCLPSAKNAALFWSGRGKYLALENLQDPANLGAIARTAEALGADGLLVSGGCDRFHPKALRASMGALLRIPLLQADELSEELHRARALGLPILAAVPEAAALPLTALPLTGGAVVLIGNEGAGLSAPALSACTARVTIPMRGRAESLNAAAAATILLWEMMRE